MSTSIKLSASIEKYLKKAESDVRNNVSKAITQAAFLVKTTAQKNIQTGDRSGKDYRRGKTNVIAKRSARGEFPKSDTGTLARSISSFKQVFGVSIVGTNIEYGEYLENKDPSKGGRPWLEPSFDQVEPKIKGLIYKAARKGLNP